MVGAFAAGLFVTIALGGIAVAIYDAFSGWLGSHRSHGAWGENDGEREEQA